MNLRRMWINQPSTIQGFHKLHGKLVLATRPPLGDRRRFVQVYFTDGDIISQELPWSILSDGWPEYLR